MSTNLKNCFHATIMITGLGLLAATSQSSLMAQGCTPCGSGCDRNVFAGGCCNCGGTLGGGFQQGCGGSQTGCTSGGGCGDTCGGGLASLGATLKNKLACRQCETACDDGCGTNLLNGGLLGKLKAKLACGIGSGCRLGGCGLGGGCGDGGCGSSIWCGHQAPSYPVPYPTPTHVGATQFTYSPFMPHHSLPHYRNTYSLQSGPGMSRTNVHWHPSYARVAWNRLTHLFEWPR